MLIKGSSEILSAKRSKNERSGIHNWHPYYAGYSETFVASAISYLGLTDKSLILDPWNGSGTTTLVSQKNGIKSHGLDINPAMVIFANAKKYEVLNYSAKILSRAKDIVSTAQKIRDNTIPTEEFSELTSSSYAKSVFALQNSIDLIASKENWSSIDEKSNPIESFLYAGLFIANRNSGYFAKGSNPTWTKTTSNGKRHSPNKFFELYVKVLESMLSDLERTYEQFPKAEFSSSEAQVGDVRNMPFPDNHFDAVITSPPYLTRIDYAVSTKPELLILGDSHYLRSIREATMGAPVIVDKNIEITREWGPSLPKILKNIENHPTKAAKSYYLPNIKQYFKDTILSLKEIKRVLKCDGSALLVVQGSYFKDIELNLGELYCEIAEAIGLEAHISRREVVKGHMAHVNTKSNKYAESKVFYEDVVEVSK